MMKKNGFTLAEVLITLAIIGVVATLTLPALMTNTAEQQAKTALKKGINTLTEAAQMNQAISGFDYASLTASSTDDTESQSLYGLLATRASVDYVKSKIVNNINPAYGSHQGDAELQGKNNFALFFRDGSCLMFDPQLISTAGAAQPGTGSADGTTQMDDGLPYGVTAIYDTNGTKGPNILSNCAGAALGASIDTGADNEESVDAVCTNANRVIKDQFGVRLRGGYAVPNGRAARWAFEN